MNLFRFSALSALTFAVVTLSGNAARASLTSFDAYGIMQYSQTANNTAPSGTPLAFFASRLFYSDSGDITSATGTSGGISLPTYAPEVGTNIAISQTGFLTPGQLDNYLLPGSALTFQVTGGTLANLSGASPAFGPTLFPSAVPYLTGNSYNSLQGLNAAQGDLITFNGFTVVNGANESDIFITITNTSTGAAVYSTSFINSPSTTSLYLPPGTLAAGTTYNLEVDYSSRLNTTGSFDGGSVPFTFGYDVRTEIGFTTAPASVPEPASLALMVIGVAPVLVATQRFGRVRRS